MRELHRAGLKVLFDAFRRRVWSDRVSIGFRTDLTALPAFPPARIPITIERVTCPGFDGFRKALARATGNDAVDLLQRAWMCEAGVRALYIGYTAQREPVFAQWLVSARDQEALHAHTNGVFPELAEDEAVFEGTYTFPRFRGLGVMGEGSRLMFECAVAEGIRFAVGYVSLDNVSQLRAIARTGAVPDHRCVVRWRFGRRCIERRQFDAGMWEFWENWTASS